jgi:hypothetical protein
MLSSQEVLPITPEGQAWGPRALAAGCSPPLPSLGWQQLLGFKHTGSEHHRPSSSWSLQREPGTALGTPDPESLNN